MEMAGIGAANLAAGLFQGFPVSTSGSRTAVAERSGAKTQLTGVTGAALIIVMIVLVPGLFRNLPQPALAAVVITASLSLADIPGTVRLWRQRRTEFLLSITAFAGVALLGVLPGIAVAVALSILNVFRRAWWPYDTELGRVEGLEGYHDVHIHPQARQLPGLVIYRFDAPLFFANATTFRRQVERLAQAGPPPGWIVIAAEPVTDVDTTASDMLEDLDQALNSRGISLVFAELQDPVRDKIERYGLTGRSTPATSTRPSRPRWPPSARTPAPNGVRQTRAPPIPARRPGFPRRRLRPGRAGRPRTGDHSGSDRVVMSPRKAGRILCLAQRASPPGARPQARAECARGESARAPPPRQPPVRMRRAQASGRLFTVIGTIHLLHS